VLVRLKQGREHNRGRTEMIQALRDRARKELNEASVRVCDLTSSYGFTVDGYPLDLMIQDETRDGTSVHLAEALAERLRQNDKITDVCVSNRPRQHRLTVDIDRTKTIALGVAIGDILEMLQGQQKGLYVDDVNRLGHIVRACMPGPDLSPKRIEDLRQLQVRNNQGMLVPLSTLATIQTNDEPGVIERWNLYSCVHVTANPAPGVPIAEARKLCETAADEARKQLGLSDKWQFTFAPP
jgi:multidrug efflux pump subunit AcrB